LTSELLITPQPGTATPQLFLEGSQNSTLQGNRTHWILSIQNGATLTITGVKITRGGPRLGNQWAKYRGGGILNAGVLTLVECDITGNWAGYAAGGGGIYNAGVLRLVRSQVHMNGLGPPTVQDGGGVYNTGRLTVLDSTIRSNKAQRDGGGLATTPMSVTTIEGSTVSSNVARRGAGIAAGGDPVPHQQHGFS
jgi:hypothetical protein